MATVGVIDLSKTVSVSEAAEIANVHEEDAKGIDTFTRIYEIRK